MSNIDQKIKKEASEVLGRIALFLAYYIGLIILGIGLFFIAGWITIHALSIPNPYDYSVRAIIFGVIALIAMWWFCIELGLYLIRPLLVSPDTIDRIMPEVSEEECPGLFSLIKEVADATGNKMPKHVYLSSEVNAAVYYDKMNFWSLFFPSRKNLMIGIGLLHGTNKSELNAILGHEFGHFSQQTMKIGSITYRLMLNIRELVEFTQERQRDEIIAQASPNYKWYFHLANYPINYITKQTVAFYKYIERKNRSLSRLMEFEADNVACEIAGVEAHISALCKLNTLTQRYDRYERMIQSLLSEGHSLSEWMEGYCYIYDLISDDESLHITSNNILRNPVGDDVAFNSRITITDGWNTHPTLSERIENANSQQNVGVKMNATNSGDLIPIQTLDAVGDGREKEIVSALGLQYGWGSVKPMPIDEFKAWASDFLKTHKIPHFIFPFAKNTPIHFELPSNEDLEKEVINSPFTEENRNMLLEYAQAERDWKILMDIEHSEETIHFTYNLKNDIDISAAIDEHKSYMESFNSRMQELDISVYKYLWKNCDYKNHLQVIYWTMFYSYDGLNAMNPLHQAVENVMSQLQYYNDHGAAMSINSELLRRFSSDFRQFMASFDYENVSRLFGGWTNEKGITVNQQMKEWQEFVSGDKMSGEIQYIKEVWDLLQAMLNTTDEEWKQRIVCAYKGDKFIEPSETPLEEEKYEQISSPLPFVGENSEKTYMYTRFSFENYNQDFRELNKIAYDNLNNYFESLGIEYNHDWSWLQVYPQEKSFQHLCISYKSYVMCIIIGLYRVSEGHGQLSVDKKYEENLIRECEKYNLTPCIFIIDCSDGSPRLPEPYLVDARTHEIIDLSKLAEDNGGVMSDWEINNIGIRCAREYLKEQGITKISYCDVVGINPQIWFEKDGKHCYAYVRSIPAGMSKEKYVITTGQRTKFSEYTGYFFDIRWNMLLGNNGDFKDKRLFRQHNPWNLVQKLEFKPLEEAIKEYAFIEIVEGESYDIK